MIFHTANRQRETIAVAAQSSEESVDTPRAPGVEGGKSVLRGSHEMNMESRIDSAHVHVSS